jgi:UDP-N-acetylglucosamine--N-acetylmuramyl-(pentapeptide) pyrophosphoryl-undecaprenol N-acetylglucosamine transferase
MTNFLLTGGGTAGHVNPLLTVASLLAEKNSVDSIFVLGTGAGLESKLVPEAGFPLLTIEKVPFPRTIGLWAMVFPFKFWKAVRQVNS